MITFSMSLDSRHHSGLPAAGPRRSQHEFPAVAVPALAAHSVPRDEYGRAGAGVYELSGEHRVSQPVLMDTSC